ncbi:MAG: hypothetical protein KAT11_01285 [Phycisphaerae bacterium]|nr:hypothetical protein [Phycisphaerae bacterium]
MVILPKQPRAEPLLQRAKAALQIGLVGTATRDLNRAARFPAKDPCVNVARQELAKLHSQAATEMRETKARVEKICSKPLVDCTSGKKPGTFCSHDVIEEVANLKRLLRVYSGFQEVRSAKELLSKLRPLPGYEQGNQRTAEIRQIDLAKEQILSGKYWPAFRALRRMGAESKDECVKELTEMEMAWLKNDPKIGNVIKMSLQAEAFAKKQSQKQMDMLQQARNRRETDPLAARQLYQNLIDEYPLSSAAKLAKTEMAALASR